MALLWRRWEITVVSLCLIFLAVTWTHAVDLDKPYAPTRKKWLELSIFQLIKVRTDPWRHRIGFLVWVMEKDNTIYVTLTSANGQDALTKEQESRYVDTVKGDVESFIRKYQWSKDLKLHMQFR